MTWRTWWWWCVCLLILASCSARVKPVIVPAERPEIWITADEAGARLVCVEIFEVGSLWNWRCLPLQDLRRFINAIAGS